MKCRRRFHVYSVLVTLAFLSACGGGSKSADQTRAAVPAIAQLNGTYAFSADGSDPADGSYFAAGSITADGKGGITGIEDLNLGSGVDSGVAITGSYQVDSSGKATVTLSDGTGVATFFTFSIPSGSSASKINFNGTGTGTLQAQSTSGFSNVGAFSFTLKGEGEGTVTGSGAFTTNAAGTFTSGNENFQDGAYMRSTSALSGTLSPIFDGGRGMAVIGSNAFSYYVVSQNQIILAGLEDGSLVYGAATKQ
jgi:hypothetical protein